MKTCLHRISNTLLINGGYLSNPGLYSGEMGLVLFFCRYARFTEEGIYTEYSAELFEKIKTKLRSNTPLDYKKGLSGIGSAVEYLVQNDYLDLDTDVILNEVDEQLFCTFNLDYLPIDKIMDIAYYTLWRLTGSKTEKEMIINSVLPQIVKAMEEWQTKQNILNPTVSFFKDLLFRGSDCLLHDNQIVISNWHQLCCENNPNDARSFLSLLDRFTNNDLPTKNALDLGFQNGLAGLGLFLISKLDGDESWLSLFPNDIKIS